MIKNLSFAVFILVSCGCDDLRKSDRVTVLSEIPSPSGRYVATSFYCEGGGAAGFCFENVDLRLAGEDLDQRNGLLGKHKTWRGFSDIEIRWIDDENLEVSYAQDPSPAYREHNAVRTDSKHGIEIHYKVKDPDTAAF